MTNELARQRVGQLLTNKVNFLSVEGERENTGVDRGEKLQTSQRPYLRRASQPIGWRIEGIIGKLLISAYVTNQGQSGH